MKQLNTDHHNAAFGRSDSVTAGIAAGREFKFREP
jgi:hypothetical protein